LLIRLAIQPAAIQIQNRCKFVGSNFHEGRDAWRGRAVIVHGFRSLAAISANGPTRLKIAPSWLSRTP
jgi:hypothetical protein